MESKIEIIEKILKEKNIKCTNQRKAIIEVFVNQDAHFKPEEVYDLVKGKKIGLATVYRTIEILKIHGIIEETTIEKDRYYELKLFSEKRLHIHFKCSRCNQIYDYDKTEMILDLIQLRNFAEQEYNVRVEDIKMIMNGVCHKCRG
ncbi:Fur family transcriptional regulator [Marinisporobacter balticus]|uniref:Fe2+ or Zn2+ uptake regulation protein n=1 Tax=Marinisporobacter balticus TaxID=2018667 RepID=A0A4R2KUK6_9FIRM|nr:Fur family transcriptional regulator [Marinisporobacter balticus]TCO74816.1 Fe2+ or Zn2+ uptake regulation protein [Marinisporobacter balticus]